MSNTSQHISLQRRKFTEQVIFYRILLLAATIAYALSSSADAFLNLHFNVFILPAAVVAFLFFSVFILSFFVDTINHYFNLIARIIIVAAHLQLIGLSVVNHFRPELLFALLSATFVASFIFQKIRTLVLFDLTMCGILIIAIFIDKYMAKELELLKAPIIRPYIDPIFFLLSEAGVMILAALLSTIRFVQFRNFIQEETPKQIFELSDDPSLVVNSLSGIIVDCNDLAIHLFEAADKSALINQPVDSLLKEPFSGEQFSDFRNKLFQFSKASALVTFISQSGKLFIGILNARKGSDNLIRISVSEISVGDEAEQKKIIKKETGERELDSYLISQSILPVACIGLDYKFTEVNHAFSELCGYSKAELKNMRLINLIHPSDQQKEKSILSNLFSGKIPVNRSEKRILNRNSRIIWVNMSSSLMRDENNFPHYVVLMIENITKQKRHERTLIKDKLNLSSILDKADLSVVSIDRNHTILFLNEKLKDVLFGLTEIVVEIGFNIKQLIPSQFLSRYEEIFLKGFKSENFVTDESVNLTEGKKLDLEISVYPIKDESGNVLSLTISGKDISDRKEKERTLINERQLAENATEAKSGFLATMSHEIRTPLNGVIGMGKLLNQTALSPKQQEYVDSIVLSGEALLSVINDILDFSKIESAKMELEKKPFAVKRCVEETFELMSSKALEKNLALQYTIQKDVPRFIVGDITRLRQILLNLVSNGIKFTSKGRLAIHVSKLKQQNDQAELLFEVRDSGIGIPLDKIDKLFKSFSQVDSSTAKTYGGTGLGLAISKNLVTLMGGKIWVESTAGEGSSFFFTINTELASTDEVAKGKSGANQLANASMLIISDDKTEVDTFTNYFSRWGMKVHSTDSIEQAVKRVQSGEKFNLVSVDAQMISAKPLEVAKRIRSLRSKDELPIILFNTDESEITIEFTDNVVSAIIPKNVDRSKLLDILIGVFAIEDHQRSQQQKGLALADKQLAVKIPLRILIAEDNSVNQLLVKNLFDGLGYKPDIVENGLLVIEKLKTKSYDIIFMDVQMPELDGLATTRFIINKMNLVQRPAIVAMTAFALEGDREKCIQAGMDDYISKPFMIEEIVAKIMKWGKSSGTSESASIKVEVKASDEKQILNLSVLNRLREISPENSDEFLRDIVNMFLQQAPVLVDEINNFCTHQRYTEMGHTAHKLKGSALNMGASALGELCRIIELKGRENQGADCDSIMSELKKVFDLTALELRKSI